MSTIVGEVSNVEGIVRAIDSTTQEVRILEEGGSVFANEVLMTSEASTALIDLNSGDVLTLGRSSSIKLDEETLGSVEETPAEILADVEALQQAILEGNIDDLEETAAGESGIPGSASQGGIYIDRTGAEGEVTSGFGTAGQAPAEVLALDEDNAVIDKTPRISIDDTDGAVTAADNSVVEASGDTVTGGLTITALEGIASITIAGQDITNATNAPVLINGVEGDLTITGYDAVTGRISYSYTEDGNAETHNATNDNVVDQFIVELTDITGATETDILDIQIIDTAPVANADADTIAENDSGVVGYVMTNDNIGADATTVTGISGGTVGSAFATTYGSLTINADGSYLYNLDNNNLTVQALNSGQTLSETFTYTITDADGDSSSTTLNVTIDGVSDNAPVITAVANSVEEGGAAIIAGTVSATAEAGIASVTIAGQEVTGATAGAPVVIVTNEGTLTVTSYNSATGAIQYSYQEDELSEDHSAGDNSVIDQFAIVATDVLGKEGTNTLDIKILDTAPTANADTDAIAENAVSVTGNVMTNDAIGADATTVTAITGGTVGTAFTTSYGTLTVNADGSYTYVLDNTNSTVQALGDGQNLAETFSYTITDADGDLSTTSLVLTINGVSDDMPTIDMGVVSQSIVEATGDTVIGSMTVTADAGFDVVTVAGQDVTNASNVNVVIGGTEGTLTITGFDAVTGAINYSYTEDGNAEMHNAANDDVLDQFAVIVTDVLGQSANDTLTVTIDDTAPTANADSRTIGEDDTGITGNVVTGTNATADIVGADATSIIGVQVGNANGAEVTGGVSASIAGTYGTLTLDASGNYSYVPNAAAKALDDGQNPTDTFSYTLKDVDGDYSTTTLTFTVTGQTDFEPVITIAGETSVVEATADTITGEITVQADNGIQSVTVHGQDVTNASMANVVIPGVEGTLTITGYNAGTGVISYSYTEDGNAEMHNMANDNIRDQFDVVVTDSANQATTQSLDITIEDTAPTANADADAIAENAVSVTGNVMTNDAIGADATTVTAITGGTVGSAFATSYGTLTVNADGSYSYLLNNENPTVQALDDGQSLTETFSYTITDADGDLSTTSLVLTINGTSDDMPTIDMGVGGGSHTIVEATGDTVTGSMTVIADAGFGAVTVAGQDVTNASNVNVVIGGTEGTLTITGFNAVTGVISYSYTEDGNAEMHNAANDNVLDQFAVIVTDALGQSVNDTLTVTIDDTAPTANADSRTVHEDDTGITGNVVTGTNATADVVGADSSSIIGVQVGNANGVEVTGGVSASIAGTYGTLVLDANGTYSYEPNAAARALDDGQNPIDTFSYTLKDADGDYSTTTLTFTVTGQTDYGPVITIAGETRVVEATADTITGEVTVQADHGIQTVTIHGQDVTNASTTSVVINGVEGVLTITGYNAGTGVISYSYTEDGNAEMHNMANDNIRDQFDVVVTDSTNQVTTNTLDILIEDTVSTANADVDSIEENTASITGNVVTSNDDLGADVTNVTAIVGVAAGTVGSSVAGSYGSLTLQADGSYVYTLDNQNSTVHDLATGQQLTDLFTYTITDADGDVSQTTLTINIDGLTDLTPVITINDAPLSVVEATADTIMGTVNVSANVGVATVTIGGQDITNASNSNVVIPGVEGTLTVTGYNAVTGVISYSYTEDGNAEMHNMANDNIRDQFDIVVTDTINQSSTETLDILIEDTVSVANADVDNIEENTVNITGNVVTSNDELGADTPTEVTGVANGTHASAAGSVGSEVLGDFGKLILQANGEYLYVLDNENSTVHGLATGSTLVDTFTYTITDADGDPSTTTLKITIDGLTDRPPVLTIDDAAGHEVVEATAGVINGDMTVFADVGVSSVSIADKDGVNQLVTLGTTNLVIAGTEGSLTITGYSVDANGVGTISYSYQEDGNAEHHINPDDNNIWDHFKVIVTDTIGQETTDDLDIKILDTQSIALHDVDVITEDTLSVDGNVMLTGGGADTLGADTTTVTSISSIANPQQAAVEGTAGSLTASQIGTAVSGQVGTEVQGAYGTVTIFADGSYTYVLNSNTKLIQEMNAGDQFLEVYEYTITDADGDSHSATLNIVIDGQDDAPPTIGMGANSQVEVVEATGGTPEGTITGTMTFAADATVMSVTIAGFSVSAQDIATASNNEIVIPGTEGTLYITGFTLSANNHGTIEYRYTEDGDAEMHNAADDNIKDQFEIVVTDIIGQTNLDNPVDPSNPDANKLVITILDTQPDANTDYDSISEGGNYELGNVITADGTNSITGKDIIGADVTSVTNFVSDLTGNSGVVGEMVDGKYGSLILNADGEYRFDLDYSNATILALTANDTRTEVFTYTLTDADGDTSQAELIFTINGIDGSVPIIDIENFPCKTLIADQWVTEGSANSVSSSISIRMETTSLVPVQDPEVIILDKDGIAVNIMNATEANPVIIDGNKGTLVITGYYDGLNSDLDWSQINYTYTPSADTEDHSVSDTSIIESFTITATDGDGESRTDAIDIMIVDTAPEAVNDEASITEYVADSTETALNAISGNVVGTDPAAAGADSIGSDATSITSVVGLAAVSFNQAAEAVVAGTYGTLTLQDSGEYVYVLDEQNRLVQLLDDGESVTDTFTYTLTDADGDTSSASLIVTVNGSNDAPIISDEIAMTGNAAISGLFGEYYAYDKSPRIGSGSGDGKGLTLANVTDFITTNTSDASFVSTRASYSAGTGRLASDNDTTDTLTNLESFLGSDAASLSIDDPALADEAVLHMYGNITLDAGTYNFKVNADNGYIIMVDGVDVASNSVTNMWGKSATLESPVFEVSESGLHHIEIIYFDTAYRSDNHVFEPVLSMDGGVYVSLDAYNLTHNQATVSGDLSDNIQRGGVIESIEHNGVMYTAADNPSGVNISTAGGGILAFSFATGLYTYTGTPAAIEEFVVNATDSENNIVDFKLQVTSVGATVSQIETFNLSNEGWTTTNTATDLENRSLLIEGGTNKTDITSAQKTYEVAEGEEVLFKLDLMTQGNWGGVHDKDSFTITINGEQIHYHKDDFSGIVEVPATGNAQNEVTVLIEVNTNRAVDTLHIENVEMIRTVNVDNILYADDNAAEHFTIGAGQDTKIIDFDHLVDTLDINDVFEGLIVQPDSLNEYLCFNFGEEDADGDGNKDVNMITIDADGDHLTENDITKIYLENSRFDEDDINNLNIDYQNQ